MEKNQRTFLGARLFILAALAVAAWAMVYKTGVASSDEAGIVMALPSQVGPWAGEDILFCPDRNCGGQYMASDSALGNPPVCPRCGKPLEAMNSAEREMLPSDTELVRKYYVLPDGRNPLRATIVLSGDDRSSIHRPQVCMTAAGYDIVKERVIRIPLEGKKKPLEVMVMDMARSWTRPDGQPATDYIYYAYWFVGKDRETASHIARMGYMAYDRIVHGVSHRWAYIALSGGRDPRNEAHLQIIADFASRLHPALLKPE